MSDLQTVERVLRDSFPSVSTRRQIEQPQHAVGFSGTLIFRITTDDQTLCLKRLPADVDVAKLTAINELLRAMARSGFAVVPAPVFNGHGQSLVQAAGQVWQLETWMPGLADFWLHPSPTRLTAAAQTLAQWHVAAAVAASELRLEQLSSVAQTAPAPTVCDRLTSLRDTLSGPLEVIEIGVLRDASPDWRELGIVITTHVRAAGPQLLFDLSQALNWTVPLQPVIRDVWHDHVLFEGEQVRGLIDFNATRTDTVAADLSRLFGSLIGNTEADWELGLTAYATKRPLSANERRLVPLLDRANVMLSGLTWLRRRYIEHRAMPFEHRVLERLQKLVARIESSRRLVL